MRKDPFFVGEASSRWFGSDIKKRYRLREIMKKAKGLDLAKLLTQ